MNSTPLGRILIVDDEAANLRALCDTLQERRYETQGAASGEQALSLLRGGKFDLLLTDLMMPGMDGVALLTAAFEIDPQLVGILMTGQATVQTAVTAMQAGAIDYVLKPIKLNAILPVLARALGVRRLRQENLDLRNTLEFHELNQAIAHTLDPNVLLEKIADAALAQFDADEVSIMLLDDDDVSLRIVAVRGPGRDALLGVRVLVSRSIAGRVVLMREPLLLDGKVDGPDLVPAYPRTDIRSALCMPMITRGRLVGVINVNSVRRTGAFPLGQIKVLNVFTNAAAAGIEAARLYDEQRKTESRYRLLIDGAEDYAILMLEPNGRVETWNSGAQRLTGYAKHEIVGRPMTLFDTPEDVAAGLSNRLLASASSDGRCEDEGWRVRKDGSRFYAHVLLTALHGTQGELLGFAQITRDITAKRRNEQEIQLLNATLEQRVAERTRQLEEASRAKSDFLANMSHELRTPLNSIIGFSELLKDGMVGALNTKQNSFVTDIFDAGSHLLSLINDILDLSKVEAGKLQLEPEALEVTALLGACLLVVRERALAHQIRLETQFDPKLGIMLADERKLKQIAYNLLSNAVKFTPVGGTVTMSARLCLRHEIGFGDDESGMVVDAPHNTVSEFLVIQVEDTGIGISRSDLPRLFQPFTQVDSSATRRHSGTGLGLSLVRRLAELHGGTVGVASQPGSGSRFRVWLPYTSAVRIESEVVMVPQPPALDTQATPIALVIEDDDRMADLITTQLLSEGFDVIRSATAEEGLVRAVKSRPQLITLDIFLPEMDGWEFMRRLRADSRLVDTPVVIITISEDLTRGLALGARRVLQKPFLRDDLVSTLKGLVDLRRNGTQPLVLVVDDNVKAVELLAVALEGAGYRVLRAYGGAEGINLAKSNRPDVVILDLMMPEVSGFEVARALRECEHTARIPILILTAKDMTPEDHVRLSSDVSKIMAKASFSRSEVLAELRRAIAIRPTS